MKARTSGAVLGLALSLAGARGAGAQETTTSLVEKVNAGREALAADSDIAEQEKLRTPNSPAFVLLGVSPTQIERPNTPKAVAVALSTFVSKDSLTVPDKFAVEFAPYWIFRRPKLQVRDYAAGGWSLVRDLTFSLGTAAMNRMQTAGMVEPIQAPDTDLAAGFRTHLYDGQSRAVCTDKMAGLRDGLIGLARTTSVRLSDAETAELEDSLIRKRDLDAAILASPESALTPEELARIEAAHPEGAARDRAMLEARTAKLTPGQLRRLKKPLVDLDALEVELKRRKEQLVADARDQLRTVETLFEQCAEASTARKGWLWEVAGAAAGRFTNARFDAREWLAWSSWSTLSYAAEGETFLLLGRYHSSKASGSWDGFLDAGLRGIVARKTYAASLEGIGRFHVVDKDAGEKPFHYRLAVVAEYMVTEGSWVSVSFGKDFGPGNTGALFTLANLNWGFGKPRVSVP
jgi:hypothetical protein